MADTPEIQSDKDQPSKLSKVDMDLGISSDNLSLVKLTKPEETPLPGIAKPSETLVGEGLYSAAYSLHSAGRGALQLVGLEDAIGKMDIPAPAEFGTSRWHAQQLGGAAGIIAPFMLTHKGVKMMSTKLAPTEAGLAVSRVLNTPTKVAIAEGALAGGAFEFTFKPTEEGDSIWTRPKNFAVGAATFGTLTASTIGIKSYAGALAKPWAQRLLGSDIAATTLSGAPAGFAHTLSHDVAFKGTDFSKYSGLQDYGKNAYTFGVVGLGLGLKDAGMAKLKSFAGAEPAPTFHELAEQGRVKRQNDAELLASLRSDIAPEAAKTGLEAAQRSTALEGGIDIKPADLAPGKAEAFETAPGKGLLERAKDAGRRIIEGEGADRRLENTVLAGSDGAKTGETFKVYDVPQEIAPSVKEGFTRALEAAKDGTSESASRFLEFAGDTANAPAAKFIIEAAHIKNDPALIDLVSRVYQLSPEVSNALRGEALTKAAADPASPQAVRDAFTEWARTGGVEFGHELVAMGERMGKPEIQNLAIETYRQIENSPLGKDLRMGESIMQIRQKYGQEYKVEGEGNEAVSQIATEAVASRLRRQVDSRNEFDPQSFEYGKFNERLGEFDRGLDMLVKAENQGTEVDTRAFGEYARGDGAAVGKALLEWAYTVNNPRMVKAIEEAYGFDYTQSRTIEGEALARSSFHPDAPQGLRDRFLQYAEGDGQAVGDYLLSEAVRNNDPYMEHAVVMAYASAPSSRLGSTLMKGVELLDAAMGKKVSEGDNGVVSEATPFNKEATAALVEYAMGEGVHLGRALEKLASLNPEIDPRAATTLKEAYLFAQNGGRRDVGDAQLKGIRHDADVIEPFLNLISKVPTNPAEYAAFKAQVIDFIARNRREITDPSQPQRAHETGYSIETDPSSPNYGKNIFEIIASQSQYSAVAGPIDFYFRTDYGLSKFSDIRPVELDYAQVGPGAEGAARSNSYRAQQMYPEFESATGNAKLVKGHQLVDLIDGMTPKQFRDWLAFGQAKAEGSELTNFDRMGIVGAKVLNRPELVEAVAKDATGDGAVKSFRDMLLAAEAQKSAEVPAWLGDHIGMKLEVARGRLGSSAQPGQVLREALPEWLVKDMLRGNVEVRPDGVVSYKPEVNADLVKEVENIRRSDPNKFNELAGFSGSSSRPPRVETLQNRFDRVEKMLSIEGPGSPELVAKLQSLAGDNPAALDQIMFRLNPERSAPEYRELIDIVTEGAKSIDDVSMLMKTINEGNNLHRVRNPKDRNYNKNVTEGDVQVNQELAISLVNQMVAPSGGKHGRALELVDGLISGRFRPPRREGGFNRGGDRGPDRGGDRGGRGKPQGRRGSEEGDGRRGQ